MDPIECIKRLESAIECRDRASAFMLSDSLIKWLLNGGFSPFKENCSDWRSGLNREQFVSYLKDIRQVAGAE